MDKESAKKLIRNTFQNSFNKKDFIYFIKNLLNQYDETKAFHARGYVPEAFKKYIKTYERIGTYIDPEGKKIDILIVYLKSESTIDRARTAQRNFIARYLKERGEKDAGLIAFVSPQEEDWRFSFVKMEYKFEKTPKGDVKVKEEFTPARRYSFLVGKNESSHTAQSFFISLLKNDNYNLKISEIEEAFSIEKVTKEFYEKYRELFLKIKDSLDEIVKKDEDILQEFQEKGVNVVDFSKKLLGQIVFLYFLQKKGWLGVERDGKWGKGPKDFLRRLFSKEYGDYKYFFNDILEPLFYEALAKERDDDFYSRFNRKIPFLNGGLFETICGYDWVHTDIDLPNELFSNKNNNYEGDGVLDIFDLFNFTVKEDEPLDKEVAIDPEMLGKVFENLLEVKDRKSKGTYYTPREIVHYMCQQSLINYLYTEANSKQKSRTKEEKTQMKLLGKPDPIQQSIIIEKDSNIISKEDIEKLIKYGDTIIENDNHVVTKGEETKTYSFKLPENIRKNAEIIDEALKNIRICDPAVGSGAFLVGMMTEIVKVRNILTNYLAKNDERTIYEFKKEAIQNCLYGVDIDSGAIEICKLRLWLSLIVDEEDINQIKSLPNLDYKIMQGDSLISEFMGIDLDKDKQNDENAKLFSTDETKELYEMLKVKKDELLNQSNINKKKILKKEIENLIISIFEVKLQEQKSDYFKKIKKIEEKWERHPVKEEREREIKIEKDVLSKKTGFNLEKAEKQLRQYTSNQKIRPFFPWKLYFSEVFKEKDGFDVVITNPPYLGEKGNKKIFQKIAQKNMKDFYQGHMDLFYFFFHLSLNLSKIGSQIAFITTNYYPTAWGAKLLRKDFKSRAIIKRLINFNELRIFNSARGQHNMITILSKMIDNNIAAKISITEREGLADFEVLQKILNWNDENSNYFEIKQKDLYEGEECYIRLIGNESNTKPIIKNILSKLKIDKKFLGEICNIHQGLKTNSDKVTNKHIKLYPELSARGVIEGENIFIINKNNPLLKRLNFNERKFVKPIFKNSDISKFYTKIIPTEYILFITKDNYLTAEHVNIKAHLNRYVEILKNRAEIEPYGRIPLYSITRPRKSYMYIGEKIVAPFKSKHNNFGYNECEWYASGDVYFITLKDKMFNLKYILGLLNSKLYYYWLYYKGKRKGEMLELYQKPLSEVPIKDINVSQQKVFASLVDKILILIKDEDYLFNSEKKSRVHGYEHQFDQMVYKLYNLTPEEIDIVEGFKNK